MTSSKESDMTPDLLKSSVSLLVDSFTVYESEFLDQISIAFLFHITETVLLFDNGQMHLTVSLYDNGRMHLTATKGQTEIRPR